MSTGIINAMCGEQPDAINKRHGKLKKPLHTHGSLHPLVSFNTRQALDYSHTYTCYVPAVWLAGLRAHTHCSTSTKGLRCRFSDVTKRDVVCTISACTWH